MMSGNIVEEGSYPTTPASDHQSRIISSGKFAPLRADGPSGFLENGSPQPYIALREMRGPGKVTKFAELHAQFVAWDTALTQYEQTATMVMLAFYSGFCQYLGYNPNTDADEITLNAINPAAEGLERHIQVDTFSKALSQDEDGVWQFGLTITMKEGTLFSHVSAPPPGETVIIKMPHSGRFCFHIRFTLRDGECNFQNADDRTQLSFPYKCVDQTLHGPPDAYIYLAGILETVFRSKPGDPPVHQPIGFELSPRG